MKKAEQIGALLKQVLGSQGLDEKLSRYQAWLVWDKVVGEQIARRARPLRLRQGTLEVQVDHPVWMQQLQMLKPQILRKLNEQVPNACIEEIYLRKANRLPPTAPATNQTDEAVQRWKQIELTAEETAEIEKQLEQLNDSELRAEMRKVFMLQKRLDKGR